MSITHIAMIMDGNGRWAKSRDLPRLEGHRAGAETVNRVLNYCNDAGIRYLTLYAFSVENWTRPESEVKGLMALLGEALLKEEGNFVKNKIRLRVMGRKEDLPESLQQEINRLEATTAHYDRQLIVALSYGGRTEITHAAKELARRVQAGTLDPETIDEAMLAQHLYLPDVPDPDLIVRTSGELRLSNFLLWQAAYTELYVTPVYWPDFNQEDFNQALATYGTRKRRYGGLDIEVK